MAKNPKTLEELFEQYKEEDDARIRSEYYGAISGSLKELYSGDLLADLVYKDNPLLKRIKSDNTYGSKYIPIPFSTKRSK